MPLSIVQASGIKSGQNVNTFNASFASLPAVGNGVIIPVSAWNSGDLAFSNSNLIDNQGNNYVLDKTFSNPTGHGACAIFRCARIRNSSGTFTITISSDKIINNWFDFCMLEIGGFNGQLKLDQSNGGIGGSPTNPVPTGNIILTDTENLVIGVLEIASNEGSIVVDVTSPIWTQQFEMLSFANNSPGEGVSKIVGPGTYSANWTVATAAQYAAAIASYSSSGNAPAKAAPPIGSVVVLSGNVIYATPARTINIEYLTTGAAILEGSLDGITFITLDTAPGAEMRLVTGVVAPYIRPSADVTAVFRKTKAKM